MTPSGIITLTTDFGVADIYVGVMKGVILSINPQARIIDLTHDIAPQDFKGAGFALAAAYSYFPAGTVHVAVIDPGVGTSRRALLIQTYSHFFVGPDNGLFSFVLHSRDVQQVIELSNPAYFLPLQSTTFHGRDVFAPVAAHLSKGVPAGRMGRPVSDPVIASVAEPRFVDQRTLQGEVIHLDRFGNIITNIHKDVLDRFAQGDNFTVTIRKKKATRLVKNYAAGRDNELFCIIGSTGLLEVSMNKKSAAEYIGAQPGDGIILQKQS